MNRSLSQGAVDFVDDARFHTLLAEETPSGERIQEILDRSLAKQPLGLADTAALLRVEAAEDWQRIFSAAQRLKETIYGNRIVLFAPLYVGNECINDCAYCGFRTGNTAAERLTLDEAAVRRQVEALIRTGHKRLILVFGEHPDYDAAFIARSTRAVYAVHLDKGEIRRVNINAAPFDVEGFTTIKGAGIGTYQVFQETYHHQTYARVHPARTSKGDYLWRLDALSRAQEAGLDDVGIGALFGLYDWRFEVLGLVAHALHLQERFGVGPHTISFPRLRPASGTDQDFGHAVSDEAMRRIIAVLRLAVPYTGLILTARERGDLRRDLFALGVSQIDAGSRIEMAGYTETVGAQCLTREQFELGDERPLDLVLRELMGDSFVPSFCTACYRQGRTGEHFMELAVPGFIRRFCTPNALTTLAEYLVDYAPPETRAAGERLIEEELARIDEGSLKEELRARLRRIRETDERDLFF
jgi:2-iminoacetate synthase